MNQIENPMKTKKVLPLLLTMAAPPMLSMLLQSMYNIVDSMFVARISDDAITAVSLVFPLQNVVSAVAIGFGVGISSAISMRLGAKKREEVNQVATHGIIFTVIHFLLFAILGVLGTKPFLRMFTQDEEIMRMGSQYAYIVICGSFGFMFQLTYEKIYQAAGNMLVPMILQGVGCLTNIILDPIMIFGLFGFPRLEVAGAALATVIGQILPFIIFVFIFHRNKYGIHISLRNFKFQRKIIKSLYSVGLPSSIMLALPSVLVSVLNGILVSISSMGVAVLGIYFKLQTFIYMPANGALQGMRPIVGYNYGARQKERVKKTIEYCLILTFVIMVIGTVVSLVLPDKILLLFNGKDELMDVGVTALRIISLGFIVSSFSVIFVGVFEAIGKGPQSLVITLIRQLVVIVPLAFLLSKYFGVIGVWLAFPIAEVIAAVVSVFMMKKYFHMD